MYFEQRRRRIFRTETFEYFVEAGEREISTGKGLSVNAKALVM